MLLARRRRFSWRRFLSKWRRRWFWPINTICRSSWYDDGWWLQACMMTFFLFLNLKIDWWNHNNSFLSKGQYSLLTSLHFISFFHFFSSGSFQVHCLNSFSNISILFNVSFSPLFHDSYLSITFFLKFFIFSRFPIPITPSSRRLRRLR